MPLNITVARSGSDSGDDYEIVGSPSSRPSSWETNVEDYYGEEYFAPRRRRSAAEAATAELQREEAELKQMLREIRRNSPGSAGSAHYEETHRSRHENRPRAPDGYIDDDGYEPATHLRHSPTPPRIRSTSGSHRPDLSRPSGAPRRPSYEKRSSGHLDEANRYSRGEPEVREHNSTLRGPTPTYDAYGHEKRRSIVIEYVPPAASPPQYDPIPVEVEAERRRYHTSRIAQDMECPEMRAVMRISPEFVPMPALPPTRESLPYSAAALRTSAPAPGRSSHTSYPNRTYRDGSQHEPESYYTEDDHIEKQLRSMQITEELAGRAYHEPRRGSPQLKSEGYHRQTHDLNHSRIHGPPPPQTSRELNRKTPESSSVRYVGTSTSGFINEIPRASPEAYGYPDPHIPPARRTEPLYSTSPSYRAPAPLPTPVKLRDPAGRVYSFPFNQCRKWSDFHELVKGACGYLEDIGPAIMADMYEILDQQGNEMRQDEWKDTLRPGYTVSLVVRGYSWRDSPF